MKVEVEVSVGPSVETVPSPLHCSTSPGRELQPARHDIKMESRYETTKADRQPDVLFVEINASIHSVPDRKTPNVCSLAPREQYLPVRLNPA